MFNQFYNIIINHKKYCVYQYTLSIMKIKYSATIYDNVELITKFLIINQLFIIILF
jgi:hypothetical protein